MEGNEALWKLCMNYGSMQPTKYDRAESVILVESQNTVNNFNVHFQVTLSSW